MFNNTFKHRVVNKALSGKYTSKEVSDVKPDEWQMATTNNNRNLYILSTCLSTIVLFKMNFKTTALKGVVEKNT